MTQIATRHEAFIENVVTRDAKFVASSYSAMDCMKKLRNWVDAHPLDQFERAVLAQVVNEILPKPPEEEK